MPQLSVQLYSVREQAAADYASTIRAIADMGFGFVEPAGYPGTSPEAAASLFRELGLRAPSGHCALPVGEQRDEILETARRMGHEVLITGCPPGFRENFTSLDRIRALADLYCEAAENAAAAGIQVGYHNHDWDLAVVDGRRAYEVFLERTPESVLWEADVYWVARAGLDPAAFIREVGPRGRFLHFKDGRLDSDAPEFLPAGSGQVDLKAAAEAAVHAEYLVVELDSFAGDMMGAIAESYDYLTSCGIARGRV